MPRPWFFKGTVILNHTLVCAVPHFPFSHACASMLPAGFNTIWWCISIIGFCLKIEYSQIWWFLSWFPHPFEGIPQKESNNTKHQVAGWYSHDIHFPWNSASYQLYHILSQHFSMNFLDGCTVYRNPNLKLCTTKNPVWQLWRWTRQRTEVADEKNQMGVSNPWGYPNSWLISWNIPSENRWELGVPRF